MKKFVLLLAVTHGLSSLCAQDELITHYESSGYLETPRYNETIAYCKKLDEASDKIFYTSFGVSPQGRALPLLIVDKDGLTTPETIREAGRIVLLVECCIHPGEPEGKDALLMLVRDMAVRGLHAEALNGVSLLVIPIFNVDGHERFNAYNRINQNGPKEMGWRVTAQNYNLNRDFLKADAPEMQQWLALYTHWLPEFFIDCHTTDGADYQYVITYALETFGNMDPGITQWLTDTYEPALVDRMFGSGFPVFRYVSFRQWHNPKSGLRTSASPPMLSQGYTAIQNRPGLLIETHMLKPYQPRVESTYGMVLHTLNILNAEKNNLTTAIRQADQWCTSDVLKDKKLPIAFRNDWSDSTMVEFLGVEYREKRSEITSGVWYEYDSTQPVTFTLPMFEKVKAEKEIRMPKAYLVPVEWSEVIEKIIAHGIEYEVLEQDTEYEISGYRFHAPEWYATPYENHMRIRDVEVEEITGRRVFPAGSLYIPMCQRAAKVVAFLLEPEADGSLFSWGFFNSIFEQKEYSETYVMEPMALKMLREDPALREDFEARKKKQPDWVNNQWEVMNWFYSRSLWADPKLRVYPVGRIY
ncbi:MAG: M14 family metallopeptidase [Bacteroidales bacterium]|nr:M14 family metallopeptidase [Bacteroidales bacterium]MDD2322774.1 M14 family metallopeptidase [Bacteroidales bacterium]MDD3010569.1 M14 family metallopeptidase [Bacteroidales bacterium]MDD3961091.1 M14 family metallopeptidase [Bacteroidales bacterium]MDY0284813.1 M14 family metallopeptidase [Bacteroidales bacterium]